MIQTEEEQETHALYTAFYPTKEQAQQAPLPPTFDHTFAHIFKHLDRLLTRLHFLHSCRPKWIFILERTLHEGKESSQSRSYIHLQSLM